MTEYINTNKWVYIITKIIITNVDHHHKHDKQIIKIMKDIINMINYHNWNKQIKLQL